MYDLLNDAAARSLRYLAEIQTRGVAPTPEAIARLHEIGGPWPDGPSDAAPILRLLDEVGSPATLAAAGPRFFGWVTGGALPATLASSWLANAWDQNAMLASSSPIAAEVETVALRWVVAALALPQTTGGGFVTGATLANLTCLAAARHAVLDAEGWDVDARGLSGAPRVTVVVGAEVHPSLRKALGLLGLGRENVIEVPVDAQGRMRADALPRIARPAIVAIQAGNVNSGAFDPAREIIAWARAAGAWVHVDGAFGLWAAAAPERAHLAAEFADADSWATDAHKWLNVPYDSGLALVREPEHLRAAMSITAAYLPVGEQRDPANYTPEFSRRARGIEVWAAMLSLGRSGLGDLIERCCRHARRFADGLSEAGYEILNDVVLNQVLVSFGSPEKTQRVIAAIQVDGTCWCGGTVWQGRAAMRISVSSWATTDNDVERSLAAMRRIAAVTPD